MNYRFFVLMIFVLSFLFSCGEDKSTNPLENKIDTIQIGTQVWMMKNLNVDHYRNGDLIPEVTDSNEWKNLKTGAWCNYYNSSALNAIYGKLYNWYAVNDPRGIAPSGWHVSKDNEWTILVNYLGGAGVAGGKMKEAGFSNWASPNTGATNESGFTALPGGCYDFKDGKFYFVGYFGLWWTATDHDSTWAWVRGMDYDSVYVDRGYDNKKMGFSVRCIKDN